MFIIVLDVKEIQYIILCFKDFLDYELPLAGGVTDFLQVMLIACLTVFINIKNRTVCFQERFRLLSLAAVLKVSIVISKSNYIVF